MKHSLIFLILTLRIVSITSESFDSEIFDTAELEFSKDISTLIIESTLKSKCDGNVFVVSSQCEKYMDHALISIREWAPPLIIVKFRNYESISKHEFDFWTKYLSWNRKPCSLIFICDLISPPPPPVLDFNTNDSLDYSMELVTQEADTTITGMDAGYLKFQKFITSLDQILYVSEYRTSQSNSCSCLNERTTTIEQELMKKTGQTLSIRVQYSVNNIPESRMQVCSQCEFCHSDQNPEQQQHNYYKYLGEWQRNKTHFGKYLDVFNTYKMQSFNNFHFRVGYFDYFPHFACLNNLNKQGVNDSIDSIRHSLFGQNKCLGIEWEILSKLKETLKFNFNLTNVGNELENPLDGSVYKTNFTKMISLLQRRELDLVVGGITVTSDRLKMVDFTQIFQTEPIVFVVQKPKNIFFLGIWLAFQPHVWPIIFILVAIMSYLFQSITNDTPPFSQCFCCHNKFPTKNQHHKKLSLSILIDQAFKNASKTKPLIVRMFDALALTLQPMLGQPLNSSQIIGQPRRFKMLLVLWWFSCLIITTLYNTSLISSLVNPVITKEPQSVDELIYAGYYFKFGGRHAAVQELINTTSPPSSSSSSIIINNINNNDRSIVDYYNNPLLLDPIDLTRNIDVDVDKVTRLLQVIRDRLLLPDQAVNPRFVAYIVEESGIGNENNLRLNNDKKIMKERLFITGYSFALPPNAHYKRKLDISLSFINAGGLINHWAEKYATMNNKNNRKSLERKFRLRERLGQIDLNLKILQGAFIFLLLSLTSACLIFGLEHWNKRYVFQPYSSRQLWSIGKMMVVFVSRFYNDNVAENDQQNSKRKKRKQQSQEKFRQVVNDVMKLRQEEQTLGTFLK